LLLIRWTNNPVLLLYCYDSWSYFPRILYTEYNYKSPNKKCVRYEWLLYKSFKNIQNPHYWWSLTAIVILSPEFFYICWSSRSSKLTSVDINYYRRKILVWQHNNVRSLNSWSGTNITCLILLDQITAVQRLFNNLQSLSRYKDAGGMASMTFSAEFFFQDQARSIDTIPFVISCLRVHNLQPWAWQSSLSYYWYTI
jgi:hypothetical protein